MLPGTDLRKWLPSFRMGCYVLIAASILGISCSLFAYTSKLQRKNYPQLKVSSTVDSGEKDASAIPNQRQYGNSHHHVQFSAERPTNGRDKHFFPQQGETGPPGTWARYRKQATTTNCSASRSRRLVKAHFSQERLNGRFPDHPSSIVSTLSSGLMDRLRAFGERTFGYTSPANYHRRAMMLLGELEQVQYSLPMGSPLTIVDWGSEYGYFSTLISFVFPESLVVSFEGDVMGDAFGHHRRVVMNRTLANNMLCRARFGRETFQLLRKGGVRFHIQLLLSVIHWVGTWNGHENSRSGWEQSVCLWLQAAQVSYVEMINPSAALEGKLEAVNPRVWYDGRMDEQQILLETMNSCNLQGTVTQVHPSSQTFPKAKQTTSHSYIYDKAGSAFTRSLLAIDVNHHRRLFKVVLEPTTEYQHPYKGWTCKDLQEQVSCQPCIHGFFYTCDSTALIAASVRSSSEWKSGDHKLVHIVTIFGETYVVKSCSFCTEVTNCTLPRHGSANCNEKIRNEYKFLTARKSDALPKVFGFCDSTSSVWLLLEFSEALSSVLARNDLMNCKEISSMLLDVGHFFLNLYNKGYFYTDWHQDQFLLTRDRRIVVVDLDGVYSKSAIHEILGQAHCTNDADCRILDNSFLWYRLREGKYRCTNGLCLSVLSEQHICQLIFEHIVAPFMQLSGKVCTPPAGFDYYNATISGLLLHLQALYTM